MKKKLFAIGMVLLVTVSFMSCGTKELISAEEIFDRLSHDYKLTMSPALGLMEVENNGELNRETNREVLVWSETSEGEKSLSASYNADTVEPNADDCTLDTFDTAEEAKKYKEYISSSDDGAGRYIYLKSYAVMTLPSSLTPERAKEYEDAFNEIMEEK